MSRKRGGTILEGYPIDPSKEYSDTFAYTGLASTFRRAGFRATGPPGRGKRTHRRDL